MLLRIKKIRVDQSREEHSLKHLHLQFVLWWVDKNLASVTLKVQTLDHTLSDRQYALVPLAKLRLTNRISQLRLIRKTPVMTVDNGRQHLQRIGRQHRPVNRMRHALRGRICTSLCRRVAALQVFLKLRVKLPDVVPESRQTCQLARPELASIPLRVDSRSF